MQNKSIFPLKHPGIMTSLQNNALLSAVNSGLQNPLFMADLEGAGPVSELEKNMADYLGVRFVLATSSGTSALHVALLAYGIGPGDEVIVSPYSWGQSVSPVLFTGATAVFADIDPLTLCLDPESVAKKITDKTKAILPVHLFGQLADISSLQSIAEERGVPIISDAAHALGATPNDQTAAQIGDITCYSLGRGKLISGGEGGLLVTNDAKIYEKAVQVSQHPLRLKREFGPDMIPCVPSDMGLNYRIHPLAAVMASADLEIVGERLRHRKKVLDSFFTGFSSGLGCGVKKPELINFVHKTLEPSSAAYGIPLVFVPQQQKLSREDLVSKAQEQNIPLRCGPVEVPLHARICEKKYLISVVPHWSHKSGSCPLAEKHCRQHELWVLSPLDMDAMSPNQTFKMGNVLRNIVEKI